MFVSDRLNISNDIIVDNYKEDDDVIEDEHGNPGNGSDALPTANKKKSNKKKPMMMLMLQKKKKKKNKKKENIPLRESCDGSASSKNINFSKPNKVVLFPFIKPNRLFHKKSTPAAASNADCFPGNTSTSCLCFKQPPTLESSSTSTTLQSQPSDPNHPDFTFDMLKSLIETNDFYSKECNPHSLDTTATTL